MSPAEAERLRTWTVDIADALLPDTRHRDEGNERRYLGQGGLTINKKSGAWYSYSNSVGGFSTVALIDFIKKCGREEAVAWAQAWLTSHVGIGTCDGDSSGDADTATPASAAQAREILASIVDVSGTAGAAYLASRRLDPPFPGCAFLRDARCGEGALVATLTSHGRTVGVQCTYLDPDGRKSTVVPLRRRLMLEKAADPVFEMPHLGGNVAEVVVCEGFEDTLSVYRFGKRRCRVLGLPGIGALKQVGLSRGTKVTIVRDGDLPGSAADKALQAGIDHLLLEGCDVYTTMRPPAGLDANAILQEAGVDELVAFLDSVEPAHLSLHGEIEKLATLTQLDYAQIRKSTAKRLGVPVAILDDEVRKVRDRLSAARAGPATDDDWADIQDTPVWLTPVDGAELLDDLEKAIGEYVIMSREQRWCVALWVLFAHAFEACDSAPKLWIKSAQPRSGKTRLVELLKELTPRSIRADAISAAMIPRVIEKHRPTLLMDEFDVAIQDNEPLRGVVNSGFDRDATIIIGVRVGDDWEPRPFSPFCPQVLAGIGKVPVTIADRSFCIELERKSRDTKVKRLRRRDRSPLQILAQKAARWAEDNIAELEHANPAMPKGLNDRAQDAWELCIAIADQCGGHWPKRARQAAIAISGDDAVFEESLGVQLLADIRTAFNDCPKAFRTPRNTVIASEDLAEWLGDLEDRPWPEYRRGRSLTKTQLAGVLKPFHVSPGTVRLGVDTSRGYKLSAFKKVFSLYLPPIPPFQSDTPTQPQENCGEEPIFETTQAPPCVISETPENASVPAACVGVSSQDPGIRGCGERKVPEPPKKGNGADPSPPEVAAAPAPRVRYQTLGKVAEMIREIHRQHPDWSTKRIAKTTGQPEARVRRALDGESSKQ